MKKTTLLLFIFCFYLNFFSQTKNFVILDSILKKPIDLVQVTYPNLEIGSVSNKDGKIRVPLKKEKILVSHLNYFQKKLSFKDFSKKDTILLKSKSIELDEVVFYNLNLMDKLINILDNTYEKEYSTKKAIHNTTYKETFNLNDSLSRLFQVQLNWGSKNSLFNGNKPMDKQNKIHIESVDYSKIKKLNKDFISSNGAYVDNKTFFKFSHLNFILIILKNLATEIEINAIEKNETSIYVTFNAVIKEKGRIVFNHKNSLIVFDKDYKHIKHLKFNMVYNSDFEDAVSKTDKIPYKKKTTNHEIELSFKKLKNNKLSLSYFISKVYAVLKTEKFTDKIVSEQSLFVSESILGKKLKKETINFNEPFYKNIPNNLKITDVKILLTEKEKRFLETNN